MSRQTIMIVDDQFAHLKLFDNLLRGEYDLIAAGSGEEALELATRGPIPDLILLDIGLPNMDGYEVCTALKADPAIRDVPIIFLSGRAISEDEIKGLKMGAVDYLSKPFRAVSLQAKVRAHLVSSDALKFERMQEELKSDLPV